MSLLLKDLIVYLDDLLDVSAFSDYCPNGLQVEGKAEIKKIITGVTASQALIDAAIEHDADAIIVHHGYFWKGEKSVLTGMKGARVKSLMQHDISLIAYHLPLDAHAELGNNAQLARLLNFKTLAGMDGGKYPVGNIGVWNSDDTAKTASELAAHVSAVLERQPILLGDAQRVINTVGWCTGSAQSMIEKAAQLGVDCFVSGEVSEQTLHLANELGLTYIGAGHHATERYGVKALGDHIMQEKDVNVAFIDIDNPV